MTVARLVERERAHLRRLIALGGLALGAGLAALLLGAGVLALAGARWITLPRWLPVAVWVGVALCVAAAAAWTRRRIARQTSRAVVATAIERERELRTGALRGALEVAEQGALGRRGAERVAQELTRDALPLAPQSRRRTRRHASRLAAAALAVALLLGTTSTTFADGWRVVAHPVRAWRGTLLPALRVDAPPQVLRGERATVRLLAPGRERVTLHRRATGAAWTTDSYDLRDGAADVPLPAADADVALYLTDGRTASDTTTIEVTERPFLADVALRAVYPRYLGRAAEALPAGEVARVPRGTVVNISGRASTVLAKIELARGSDVVPLLAAGQRFSGRLVAGESGSWQWRATGAAGAIRDVPPPIALEVVADSAPRVEILDPARDTTVATSDRVALTIAATDDHGLAGVTLRSWRVLASGAAQPEAVQRLDAGAETPWTGQATLDLAGRGLEPGDALHVVAAAVDASPWRQAGQSRELVLRVPGMAEQRLLARQAAESAAAGAAALAGAQRQLQQRTSEQARSRGQRNSKSKGEASSASSRGGGSPLSFESAEQAKGLAREQQELAQRVQELQRQAKALENKLREAGALDSGLASRLQEAQRMLRDALTPQLAEQLRKIQEAAQNLDGDDTRQALGDLAAQQQQLREQLERSVEMLKRAALEGSMETLRDEAAELAQKQQALAEQMEQGKAQQSPRESRELAERSRDLTKDVSELAKRLEQEKADVGAQRAREAREHAQQSAEQMQRAAAESGREQRGGEKSDQGEPREGESGEQSERGKQDAAQKRGEGGGAEQRVAQRDEKRAGQPQQSGQPQQGGERGGEQSGTQPQAGAEGARQRPARAGEQGGQPQAGQRGGQQRQQEGAEEAREAADEMSQAAEQLAQAREAQVDEWKQELTADMDRTIQEMLQMSREETALAEQAQSGGDQGATAAKQSAVQQGVKQAGERMQKAGQKSSLVSSRSQRAMADAQSKVDQAGKEANASSGSSANGGAQTAQAMREAAEALNQAAASLVRDRERANSAQSASGFSEMMQELQEMAQQQGQLNSQASGLSLMPGGSGSAQAQAAARALARRQRGLAEGLEEVGEGDESGRTSELAKEARQIAQALERGAPDAATLERQQRLYRRLLDAGKTLEQDERDESGKREARAASGTELFNPGTDKASGRAASRFREPDWNELRGLTAEERRLVLEYFKRINAEP